MRQRHFKALLTIFCLMATSVVTIATSKSRSDDYKLSDVTARGEGVYYVASTCPGSMTHEKIKLERGVIIEPQGLNAGDFGLPGFFIDLDTNLSVNGEINGYQRICRERIVDDQGVRLNVYDCVDEVGHPICKITFERESVF